MYSIPRPLETNVEGYLNSLIIDTLGKTLIPVNFGGVVIHDDVIRRSITVEIPLNIPEDKAYLSDDIKVAIKDILNEARTVLPFTEINARVLVNLLPAVSDVEIKIKESEDKNMFVPEVKKIIHRTSNRGEFFTVVWRDDTTTTVKLMEGETSDDYTAFLYALGKKMFGDKGKGRAFVREKKEVFEEEMRQKAKEKKALRRRQAIQQSIDRECEDLSDLGEEVYGAMFVAPALIPKKMFKKNRGNE